MPAYRVYFTLGGHFRGVEDIEAADDAEAIREAERLFAARTDRPTGFEVWCRTRQVYSKIN